jgi:hypothetical protein
MNPVGPLETFRPLSRFDSMLSQFPPRFRLLPPEIALSLDALLNHHPEDCDRRYVYCREPLIGSPVDPGPHNPYDPGPAPGSKSPEDDHDQRPGPKKVIPCSLLGQLSQEEIERYESLNYSKQEGYVARLMVKAENFSMEDSDAWQYMLQINAGRPPTSIQIRRFLQHLETHFHIKVPRPEKRYRTNGIMWIDRNWELVKNFIHILPCIPKDSYASMIRVD